MSLSSLFAASQDSGSRVSLPVAYISLIGSDATNLLQYVCDSLARGENTRVIDDLTWCKQDLAHARYHTGLSRNALRTSRHTLVGEALLSIVQDENLDTYWTVNQSNLFRFWQFATAYRSLHGSGWTEWAQENPDIVSQFNHLLPEAPKRKEKKEAVPDWVKEYAPRLKIAEDIPAVDTPISDSEAQEKRKEIWGEGVEECSLTIDDIYNTEDTPVEDEEPEISEEEAQNWESYKKQLATEYKQEKVAEKKESPPLTMTERLKEKLAPKKKVAQRRCRYVEYWNSLPHVPKCRHGTQAYAFARRFFEAHRRYQAGETTGCMLTEDVRQKIHLDRINSVPENALRTGKDKYPVRSDDEMKKHIRQAARAFDPKYTPMNKKFLGNLASFLYKDGKFSKRGTVSLFLENLAWPPQPIEDESYDSLLDNAQDYELDFVDVVKYLYFLANNRDQGSQLSLSELKSALSVARQIIAAYKSMPLENSSILISHFSYYNRFIDWWKRYCEDQVWEGMPITALGTTKDLWRRFLDHVRADTGYDLMTGERCS